MVAAPTTSDAALDALLGRSTSCSPRETEQRRSRRPASPRAASPQRARVETGADARLGITFGVVAAACAYRRGSPLAYHGG